MIKLIVPTLIRSLCKIVYFNKASCLATTNN